MNNDTHRERYYTKEKYEASIGAFVVGIIFVFVAILSFVFMRLNINFLSLRYWGYWMLIPAFFLFTAGFHQIYVNMQYKKAVKNALSQRDNKGTHKLEHIAIEIGIKPKDATGIGSAATKIEDKLMYLLKKWAKARTLRGSSG